MGPNLRNPGVTARTYIPAAHAPETAGAPPAHQDPAGQAVHSGAAVRLVSGLNVPGGQGNSSPRVVEIGQ